MKYKEEYQEKLRQIKKRHHRILIADDSSLNRMVLTDILKDEFEILEACDGQNAVELLRKNEGTISLLLLDIVMPKMDGYEILMMMNKYHWIDDIPVIMISSNTTEAAVQRTYELGATDYISRPFTPATVHRRVMNAIMLSTKQKDLMSLAADQIYEREKNGRLMANILSHIVETHNSESRLHVLNINKMVEILAKALVQKTNRYPMSHEEIALLCTASSLHDIGKIGIPEEILNKPGKFTPEEFEIMKKHSAIGADMIQDLPFGQDELLVKIAYEVCRWHHERYDGNGYPDGLKGDDIPITAQIVSLADVYDALTSERVYKKAFPHERAVQMIVVGECGRFNPILLDCLLDNQVRIREELNAHSDSLQSDKKIQNVVEELLHHENLSTMQRMLNLLEYERTKHRFLTSISKEIEFEYVFSPPMLSLSPSGAQTLHMCEVTMNPSEYLKNTGVISGEIYEELKLRLLAATPANPVVQIECICRLDCEERLYQIVCRTLWSEGETPECLGIVGKLIDMQKESCRQIKQIAANLR